RILLGFQTNGNLRYHLRKADFGLALSLLELDIFSRAFGQFPLLGSFLGTLARLLLLRPFASLSQECRIVPCAVHTRAVLIRYALFQHYADSDFFMASHRREK